MPIGAPGKEQFRDAILEVRCQGSSGSRKAGVREIADYGIGWRRSPIRDPDVSDQPTSQGMHELSGALRCGGISCDRLRG